MLLKKEENLPFAAVWMNWEGENKNNAKWNKQDRERQILYCFIYTQNLKTMKKVALDKYGIEWWSLGQGRGETGDLGQRVQIFSYMKKKLWSSNGQHGDSR